MRSVERVHVSGQKKIHIQKKAANVCVSFHAQELGIPEPYPKNGLDNSKVFGPPKLPELWASFKSASKIERI